MRLHVIPGDASDRCSSQPPGRPSHTGGLFAQPGKEASGSWRQHAVICCMAMLECNFKSMFTHVIGNEKVCLILTLSDGG